MKANDKAIEALADVLQHHGVFHGWFPKGLPSDWRQLDPIGRREFLDIAGRLADAAYAAQFPPSEDYAGLIARLRICESNLPGDRTLWYRNPNGPDAADALEAVLAERDELKAVVEIYEKKLNGIEDEIRLAAQSAIAAVRPHIEAAERERCAKAVEKVAERINVAHHERPEWEDGYLQGVHDAAAAIRSRK